jgi:hypothetical protein
MDKTLAGLIGAMGALAASAPAHATNAVPQPADPLQATSYADLLRPIPNALAALQQVQAQEAIAPVLPRSAGIEQADWHDHHHHHHHRVIVRHHHHHHHHHHHNAVVFDPFHVIIR